MTVFDRPRVIPCSWQDVKIQLLANSLFDVVYSPTKTTNQPTNQPNKQANKQQQRKNTTKTHKTTTTTKTTTNKKDFPLLCVPADSPSRGWDVTVYVSDMNQPSLPTPFYFVLVSISVFRALSTVFYSINSPHNSPLSLSVLSVLSLPYLSFQPLYLFMKISFSPDIIRSGWLGLKHQLIN